MGPRLNEEKQHEPEVGGCRSDNKGLVSSRAGEGKESIT